MSRTTARAAAMQMIFEKISGGPHGAVPRRGPERMNRFRKIASGAPQKKTAFMAVFFCEDDRANRTRKCASGTSEGPTYWAMPFHCGLPMGKGCLRLFAQRK